MRVETLVPRAEKMTLVLEAIGDDKVRIDSKHLSAVSGSCPQNDTETRALDRCKIGAICSPSVPAFSIVRLWQKMRRGPPLNLGSLCDHGAVRSTGKHIDRGRRQILGRRTTRSGYGTNDMTSAAKMGPAELCSKKCTSICTAATG
jgi:hypothetical protein